MILRVTFSAIAISPLVAETVAGGVTSVKAGRNIPTGIPSRYLTLEVEAQPADMGAAIPHKTLGS